jgi:hypothetical protein
MKVWAKNEHLRKLLKHPVGGGFPADTTTPAEWPDDSFTHRLVQDGDILKAAPTGSTAMEQPTAKEAAEEDPKKFQPPKRKE